MTDNEIIKALECCCDTTNMLCSQECPLCDYDGECGSVLKHDILSLINRQKAEIERLEKENEELEYKLGGLLCHATGGKLSKSTYSLRTMESAVNDCIEDYCHEAESEAIKEFAERLKKSLFSVSKTTDGHYVHHISGDEIDNLVKEMVGDEDG